MATEDITLRQFHIELGAAKTAMEGSDYVTARQKIAVAQVTLSGIWKSHGVSDRSYAMETKNLNELLAAVDAHERATNGGGRTQIVGISFGRPG